MLITYYQTLWEPFIWVAWIKGIEDTTVYGSLRNAN